MCMKYSTAIRHGDGLERNTLHRARKSPRCDGDWSRMNGLGDEELWSRMLIFSPAPSPTLKDYARNRL